MKRRLSRLTWLEYLVAFVCLLLVLRLFFAGTIRGWERELLGVLGLDARANLIIGVPVLALVFYWRFRRSKWSSENEPGTGSSRLSAVDTIVILLGAGAVVWMAVA